MKWRRSSTGQKSPEQVLKGIRFGRMTALQKLGDVFRRLVARTLAQQYSKVVEAVAHPFQCALSTRARTECVTHIVQALTSENPEVILSIDGIGVRFDMPERHVARAGRHVMATS